MAAAMFVSCAKHEGPAAEGSRAIAIDPVIARATEVDFEAGDEIGLTIVTPSETYCSDVRLAFDGAKFSSADLKWYEDTNVKATLKAYYPYTGVTAAAAGYTFAVREDQTGDGYGASDFMGAVKNDVAPSSDPVLMTFTHKLTKLNIAVRNNTGSDVVSLAVSGGTNTAAIDAETLEAVATDGVDAQQIIITANEVEKNHTYKAIVIPQTVAFTVEVETADGKRYSKSLTETALAGGHSYNVTVTIGGDQMFLALAGSIEAWTDGGEIGGAVEEPSFEEFDDYFVYDGERYNIVTLADGNKWMAENLRYVPAGKTVSGTASDKSGVWYPCNLSKEADPALVATAGLIYSYPVMFDEPNLLTTEKYDTVEGVRGICPEGWHIPTMAEWLKLTGAGSGNLSDSSSPYYTSEQGGAPIADLNADGFNVSGCGYINAGSAVAAGAYNALPSALDANAFTMAYFPSSTAYQITYNTAGDPASGIKNIQYYAGMLTYNAKFQRISVAFQGAYGGSPVRCIKNK